MSYNLLTAAQSYTAVEGKKIISKYVSAAFDDYIALFTNWFFRLVYRNKSEPIRNGLIKLLVLLAVVLLDV